MGLRPRIPGYDLARYLAVFGFVVVDMVGAVVWGDHGAGFGERPEGPVVLYWSWQLWWGRASAMLAVLAGTGLALLFREGLGDDERARKRRVVLRRCVFLFATGHLWNSSTLWSFSILHYYTFFLAIGLLFVRACVSVSECEVARLFVAQGDEQCVCVALCDAPRPCCLETPGWRTRSC